MEASPVKEMLKDLCHERWGWSYAVFWKPKCDNSTLFVWEDGYCRPCFVNKHQTALFHDDTDLETLVFILMVNQVHALGDGIVGRAASVGAYEWFLRSVYTGNNKSMLLDVELQLQFSAGIQTIVVIPLLPHGVLQLGSNRMIMENVGFVNKLKGLFLHQRATPALLPITNTLLGQSHLNRQNHSAGKRYFDATSDVLGMSPLDFFNNCQRTPKVEVPSILRKAYSNTQSNVAMQSPCPSIDSSKLAKHHSGPSLQQTVSFLTNNDPSTFLGTEPHISELIEPNPQVPVDVRVTTENNKAVANSPNYCNSSSFKVAEWKSVYGPPSSSAVDINCSLMPNRFNSSNNLPCLRDQENDLFQALGITPSATTALENSTSYFTRKREFEPQMPTPASGDLFDASHVKLRSGEFSDNSTDPYIGHYSNAGNSSGAISTFVNELIQPSNRFNDFNFADTIMSASEFESLLDAVTWKTNSDSKQNSNGGIICCTEPSTGTVSCSDHAETAPNNQRPLPRTEEDQLHIAPQVLAGAKFTQTGSCFDYVHDTNNAGKILSVEETTPVKSDVEDDKSAKETRISTGNSVRAKEMGKLRRNKSRPGEGSRPRPKDRQMIQDRLKDLRELIPDGEKYSIDALLERTIKHMLFLQSVTKHAEKMKQSQEWKGMNDGLALKEDLEVGATWAFEVGSQSMLCPIIVEDLSAPHQMLVEILCGEDGSFLEIADTLRRMGLTILKGVMESRNGSMWARFVVEAQKDVTRMEVFMSLMQFLEAANLNPSGYGRDLGENTLRKASMP